jgi:hypothetical protein
MKTALMLIVMILIVLVVGPSAYGGSTSARRRSDATRIIVRAPVPISVPGSGTYWWAHMDSSPTRSGSIMVCGTRSLPSVNAAEGFVYLSPDYGRNWREVLTDSSTKWVSEHSCAFGKNGRAYFLSSRSAFFHGLPHHDQGQSRLYQSFDDGMSWNTWEDWPFIDYSSTAVDLRPSLSRDLVFVFANDIDTNKRGSGPGLITYSGDVVLRATHTVPIAEDSEFGRVFSASPTASTVLDDGTAIAVLSVSRSKQGGTRPWANVSATRHLIEALRSNDGGSSLMMPIPVSEPKRFGQLSAATLAVDRSLGIHRGRVYAAWAENTATHIGIMLATSDDSGRTWVRHKVRSMADQPRELADGSSPGITTPSIAANRMGIVGLFWVENEGRCPYFAMSADGGSSFQRHKLIPGCSTLGLHDLSWYSRYLFTWPESEADELGQERDESRVGLRLEMHVQSLTPSSMTTDDHGDFHPMWLAMRSGGSQLWTSTITVVSGNLPAPVLPSGLIDISPKVALEFTNNEFDARHKTFSVDVKVVNRAETPLRGPFLLQTEHIKSTMGRPELSEDNSGAVKCGWTPRSHLVEQDFLPAGQSTMPARISARLDDIRRTDKGEIDISLRVCGRDP